MKKNDIGDEEELNEEADVEDIDVEDDDIDELDELHPNEWNKLLKETTLVCEVVTKVCIETWKLHIFRCSVLLTSNITCLGSKAIICNHPFDNDCTPGMVVHVP